MHAPGASFRRRLSSPDGILSALLGLIVVYSCWTYARLALTRPTPEDYVEATAYVRAGFEPGDLIDANPFWATRVREYLGDRPLVAWRRVDVESVSPYRRLWLFSLFDAEARAPIRDGL